MSCRISRTSTSTWCYYKASELRTDVRCKVRDSLINKGVCRNLIARAITPVVATGTLAVSVGLNIAAVVEPLIRILGALAKSLFTLSTEPLKDIKGYLIDIPENLVISIDETIKNIFNIGFGVGVLGLLAPGYAYHHNMR